MFGLKRKLLLLCLIISFLFNNCAHKVNTKIKPTCYSIPGLNTWLTSGQIILLGEIHGTEEGPKFVEHIVCNALDKNLNVSIGLELPKSDEAVINAYLKSTGSTADKKKVLQLSFWKQEYQDGRASRAMFDLLEEIRVLHATKKEVTLILIDDPSSIDRDLSMAEQIITRAKKEPSDLFIVLTGNYHNMVHENGGYMGSYVLAALGAEKVLSLKQNFTVGSAWVDIAGEGIGPAELKGDGRHEIGVFLDETLEAYHGTLEMDSIHYSRPAKEMFDE